VTFRLHHAGWLDYSVNGARIYNMETETPVFVTNTQVNAAGAYNGAGVGNKAILGCTGYSGTALGAITSIYWEWEHLSFEADAPRPYVNFIVQMTPGVYRIFALDPAAPAPLNIGTLTNLGSNRFSFMHTTATNSVQVVNAFTTAPFVSPPVPVAHGAAPWPSASFNYSDILSSFPAAALIDVSSLDGGMPKTTVTPSMLLALGDSSNVTHRIYRILDFKINGVSA